MRPAASYFKTAKQSNVVWEEIAAGNDTLPRTLGPGNWQCEGCGTSGRGTPNVAKAHAASCDS